jgi:hypothetical protein
MGTDKREGREAQGCAWASQASMDFQIPSQASLHWIMKPHRPFCCANGPVSLRNLWKNLGLRLASKRGCVVKKHPQVGLRVSYPQQIQHSRSESTHDFYLGNLTCSLPLISPCGPTFGCSTAHLPGAWLWLKAILDFIPLELFTSHL